VEDVEDGGDDLLVRSPAVVEPREVQVFNLVEDCFRKWAAGKESLRDSVTRH
jgi:hypothetical protein